MTLHDAPRSSTLISGYGVKGLQDMLPLCVLRALDIIYSPFDYLLLDQGKSQFGGEIPIIFPYRRYLFIHCYLVMGEGL